MILIIVDIIEIHVISELFETECSCGLLQICNGEVILIVRCLIEYSIDWIGFEIVLWTLIDSWQHSI